MRFDEELCSGKPSIEKEGKLLEFLMSKLIGRRWKYLSIDHGKEIQKPSKPNKM